MNRLLLVCSIAVLGPGCAHRNYEFLYFTTPHPEYGLSAIPVRGGEPTLLAKGLHIDTLAYDPKSGHLLTWESGWDFGIMRRNLDGSVAGRFKLEGNTRDLVVDAARGHLYLATDVPSLSSAGAIRRMDLADGGNRRSITGPELKNINAIAIDPRRKKLYSATGDEDSRVWRSNLDGSEREQIGPDVVTSQVGVDPAGGWVFFHERTPKSRGIWRCRLDGSGPEPIIPVTQYAGVYGLIVDPAGRKLYWVENSWHLKTSAIRRSDLDGRNVETIHERRSPAPSIGVIAFGPDPRVAKP